MKLTGHAKERMAEMGIDADEVYDTVRHPDVKYISDRHRAKGDREVRIKGRLAIIIENDKRIVTVLWHTGDGREWDRTTGSIQQEGVG